ncbi:MAG: hypothetical protein U1E05_25090 [Patescibacteria group bacterium]|nr:hypothetical protein [Patescibacteria group bacterium]
MNRISYYLPELLWHLSGTLWVLSIIPLIMYPGILLGGVMALAASGTLWAPGIDGFFISVFLWGTMLYPLVWFVAFILVLGAGPERSREKAVFYVLPVTYLLLLMVFPVFGWLIWDFTPESRAVSYPPLQYQLNQENVIQRPCRLVVLQRECQFHKGIYYRLLDDNDANNGANFWSEPELPVAPGTKVLLTAVKLIDGVTGPFIAAIGTMEMPSTGAVEFIYRWSDFQTLSRAPWEPDDVPAKRLWKDFQQLELDPNGQAIEAVPGEEDV